jgi:DNA-binding NarL/FixJ family response regulator
MIRLIIVDDQKVVTQGLKLLLETEADIQVVALGANGKDAIALVTEHQPDVLLIDQQMPVLDGIEATKQILQHFPNLAILLLSASDDDSSIRNAMLAGAKGYLLKSTSGEDLARSIRAVHRGYSQMSPGLMEKLISNSPVSPNGLSSLQSSPMAELLAGFLQSASRFDPEAIADFLDSVQDKSTAMACLEQLKTTLQRQPDHIAGLYITGSLVQKFQPHPQKALTLFQKALEQAQRRRMPRTDLFEICRCAWNVDSQTGFKWLCSLIHGSATGSQRSFFQDLAQVFGQQTLAYRQLVAFWQIQVLKDLCTQADTLRSKFPQRERSEPPKSFAYPSLPLRPSEESHLSTLFS